MKLCNKCKTKNDDERTTCICCKTLLGCTNNNHVILKVIHGDSYCKYCGEKIKMEIKTTNEIRLQGFHNPHDKKWVSVESLIKELIPLKESIKSTGSGCEMGMSKDFIDDQFDKLLNSIKRR